MASLLDGVVLSSATTGTGTLTLGSAVNPYLTMAQAGGVTGTTYSYSIIDSVGGNSEYGTGVWTSGGTNGTLTRATILWSTNSGAAISCSGLQVVRVGCALAETFSYLVSYLVVGGGGPGASGQYENGGGGAGQALSGSLSVLPSTTYTVTVGAGGAASTGTPSKGNNSVLGSVTSLGGGYGASPTVGAASSGGSGGGGDRNTGSYGAANGTGTSAGGQGDNSAGGGGGGAGGAGAAGVYSVSSGNGGAGLPSSITGTAVTYACGGGGGGTYAGTGGSTTPGVGDGGGTTVGTAGGANTGSGGGGASGAGGNLGGGGGSGVVILSMPTSKYSGVYTGSPTITSSGGNVILTFNSSGSYTA